jgi:hypothetical protein
VIALKAALKVWDAGLDHFGEIKPAAPFVSGWVEFIHPDLCVGLRSRALSLFRCHDSGGVTRRRFGALLRVFAQG